MDTETHSQMEASTLSTLWTAKPASQEATDITWVTWEKVSAEQLTEALRLSKPSLNAQLEKFRSISMVDATAFALIR